MVANEYQSNLRNHHRSKPVIFFNHQVLARVKYKDTRVDVKFTFSNFMIIIYQHVRSLSTNLFLNV